MPLNVFKESQIEQARSADFSWLNGPVGEATEKEKAAYLNPQYDAKKYVVYLMEEYNLLAEKINGADEENIGLGQKQGRLNNAADALVDRGLNPRAISWLPGVKKHLQNRSAKQQIDILQIDENGELHTKLSSLHKNIDAILGAAGDQSNRANVIIAHNKQTISELFKECNVLINPKTEKLKPAGLFQTVIALVTGEEPNTKVKKTAQEISEISGALAVRDSIGGQVGSATPLNSSVVVAIKAPPGMDKNGEEEEVSPNTLNKSPPPPPYSKTENEAAILKLANELLDNEFSNQVTNYTDIAAALNILLPITNGAKTKATIAFLQTAMEVNDSADGFNYAAAKQSTEEARQSVLLELGTPPRLPTKPPISGLPGKYLKMLGENKPETEVKAQMDTDGFKTAKPDIFALTGDALKTNLTEMARQKMAPSAVPLTGAAQRKEPDPPAEFYDNEQPTLNLSPEQAKTFLEVVMPAAGEQTVIDWMNSHKVFYPTDQSLSEWLKSVAQDAPTVVVQPIELEEEGTMKNGPFVANTNAVTPPGLTQRLPGPQGQPVTPQMQQQQSAPHALNQANAIQAIIAQQPAPNSTPTLQATITQQPAQNRIPTLTSSQIYDKVRTACDNVPNHNVQDTSTGFDLKQNASAAAPVMSCARPTSPTQPCTIKIDRNIDDNTMSSFFYNLKKQGLMLQITQPLTVEDIGMLNKAGADSFIMTQDAITRTRDNYKNNTPEDRDALEALLKPIEDKIAQVNAAHNRIQQQQ